MYWALIETIALLSWGVGAKAIYGSSFFGINVSSSTRNRKTRQLTSNNASLHTKMLSRYKVSATCYDNYQRGVPLLHQCGGHSSSFLKGTHEITHLMNEFDNRQFNDQYVDLAYLPTQNYPSPHGMSFYETVNHDHLGTFFAGHESMPSAPEPDFSDERVRSYIKLRDISDI